MWVRYASTICGYARGRWTYAYVRCHAPRLRAGGRHAASCAAQLRHSMAFTRQHRWRHAQLGGEAVRQSGLLLLVLVERPALSHIDLRDEVVVLRHLARAKRRQRAAANSLGIKRLLFTNPMRVTSLSTLPTSAPSHTPSLTARGGRSNARPRLTASFARPRAAHAAPTQAACGRARHSLQSIK